MSVDLLKCKHCERIFADCEDFIICENCFEVWCCESCAEADGYVPDKCSLGYKISDCSPEDEDECNEEWCSDCDNFVIGTCGYCREEKFTDEELLEFAIKKLGLETKEQLNELLKNENKTIN